MISTDDIRRASAEAHTRFMRGDAYAASELENTLATHYPALYSMVRSREYREDILMKMLAEMDAISGGANARRAEERVGQHMADIYVYPKISSSNASTSNKRQRCDSK